PGPLQDDLLVARRVPVLRPAVGERDPRPRPALDLDVQVPLDAAVVHAGAADVGPLAHRAAQAGRLGAGAAAVGPADRGGQDAQRYRAADPGRGPGRPGDRGREAMRGRALRAGQHELDAGLRVHRVDVHVDHELTAGVLAVVQHGRRPGQPHLELAAPPPGPEPDSRGHLTAPGTLG